MPLPLTADPAVRRVERRLAGVALLSGLAIGLAVLNDLIAPADEGSLEAAVPIAPLPELAPPPEASPGGDLIEALKRPQAALPGATP